MNTSLISVVISFISVTFWTIIVWALGLASAASLVMFPILLHIGFYSGQIDANGVASGACVLMVIASVLLMAWGWAASALDDAARRYDGAKYDLSLVVAAEKATSAAELSAFEADMRAQDEELASRYWTAPCGGSAVSNVDTGPSHLSGLSYYGWDSLAGQYGEWPTNRVITPASTTVKAAAVMAVVEDGVDVEWTPQTRDIAHRAWKGVRSTTRTWKAHRANQYK